MVISLAPVCLLGRSSVRESVYGGSIVDVLSRLLVSTTVLVVNERGIVVFICTLAFVTVAVVVIGNVAVRQRVRGCAAVYGSARGNVCFFVCNTSIRLNLS